MNTQNTIAFTAFGHVQPAHRPRATVIAGHARMYNDKRHDSWMDSIRAQAYSHRPETLIAGPIRVKLAFYLIKPKSKAKKIIHHIARPDVDNLTKAALDALKGLLWRDDTQVVELVATKSYGDPSRVEVIVEALESGQLAMASEVANAPRS